MFEQKTNREQGATLLQKEMKSIEKSYLRENRRKLMQTW